MSPWNHSLWGNSAPHQVIASPRILGQPPGDSTKEHRYSLSWDPKRPGWSRQPVDNQLMSLSQNWGL